MQREVSFAVAGGEKLEKGFRSHLVSQFSSYIRRVN